MSGLPAQRLLALARAPGHRWWQHEWTPEAMERDSGPSVDGTEPNEDWLALRAGMPVGLVQTVRSRRRSTGSAA